MDQADGKRPLEEPVEPDAKSQRLDASAEAAQAADAAVEAALGAAEPAPAPERTRRRRSGWDEAGDGSQVAPPMETPMSVPPGGNMVEFKVEQSMVGFLIGKGGENLKSMETSSTATIKIDQGTKEMGYSMIRVTGSEPAVATAKALLDQRIAEKTSTSKPAGQAPSQQSFASFTSDPAATNGTVGWECQLEQSAVGFFIGKQGEYIKRIQAQTGATIVIDQDTKEQGYSMIRIMEGPGLQQGADMVRYRIEQVKEAALQRAPAGEHEEITVQQHLVGAIIGRGGETLKQIKAESGATVVLTQDTKDQGFSVVRFGGPAECVARAVEMVRQRLAEREAGKGQGKGWEKGGSWGDNGGFGSGKGGWGEGGGCAGINPPPPPPPPKGASKGEWGDGNWNGGNWGNDNSWGDNSGQWGNNSSNGNFSNGGCCGGCDGGCGNYGGCNGCGGCGDFNAGCQGGCCSSCGGCGCAPPPPPPPPPAPAASTGPSQEAMAALQALQSGGPMPTIRGPESQPQQQQQQPVDQFQQMQMDQLQQQQLMQQQQMQLQQQQLLQQQQMQQQQMQFQPQADYSSLLAQQLSQPLDPNALAQQQLQQQAFVQPAGC